jgi:hypothetical protein
MIVESLEMTEGVNLYFSASLLDIYVEIILDISSRLLSRHISSEQCGKD